MPPNSRNFIKKRGKKYKGEGTRPKPSKEKPKSKKKKTTKTTKKNILWKFVVG